MSQFKRSLSKNNLEKLIEKLLLALDFKNKLLGFNYLRDAIAECCVDDKKRYMSTDVYMIVAKKYKTTNVRVERAIRNAIINCHDKGNLFKLNDIFNNSIVSEKYVPTSAELISAVSFRLYHVIHAGSLSALYDMFDKFGFKR